jgi:hypothetical protein
MKTSNKLLLGLLILILLASTTLVGMAKYYQTQTTQSRTSDGNTGQLYWPEAPLFVYAHAHSHLNLYA